MRQGEVQRGNLPGEGALSRGWKLLWRTAACIVAATAGAAALYALAALAGALFPQHGRIQATTMADPPVFVCASLVHTDIVIPLGEDAAGWRESFPEATLHAPDEAYLAIGWGDLGFYTQTPTWSDFKVGKAFHAVAGLGPAALRVIAIRKPAKDPSCIAVAIDLEGRKALAEAIRDTARAPPSGKPVLLETDGRGVTYYASKGRYSPLRTCNVWTADMLRQAGLPTAFWAPFPFGVTLPVRP